ncbi:MAG: hypothetical protein Q8R91_03095 [Candidatus Omnitrophota bacterium]|nr:hypothetical protein [Candidatus Omnitrophota bacterium]
MGLCTLLYTVTRFTGLEYLSLYFGGAFQVLHPESFSVDRYMPPFRPTLLSLYYVIVRLTGDLWLDDRFTIFVYGGLVLLAVVALDKTARLFGADRPAARVAMLSLMLMIGNGGFKRPQFVSALEFNPTTMAGPVIFWMLYLALAGKHPALIFVLMVLLALISPKNVWLPILIGLTILFKERLTTRAKWRVGLCVLGLIAAVLGVYYVAIRPGDPNQVALFDFILYEMEGPEANPFWDTWWHNLAFVVVCAGAWWVKLPSVVLEQRVKTIAVMGAAVWLLGGLYLSYAPDILKIPYVVPFEFERALCWTQYVLLVAIAASALRRLGTTSSWRGVWVCSAVVLAIYQTPFHLKRASVVGVLLGLMWLWWYVWARCRNVTLAAVPSSWRLRIIAAALGATTLSTLVSWTVHRWPALRFLAQHGIMGDNPGAKWVGINEYFRERTPPDSTVLALTMRDYPWRAERFKFEGSLRTRSGRSMPFGPRVVFIFDYPSIMWSVNEREPHHDPLIDAWERHDASGVTASLSAIGAPDYLVVPTTKAQWLHDRSSFPYRVETVIGEFTILRKAVSL